jgi:hypothetical protein
MLLPQHPKTLVMMYCLFETHLQHSVTLWPVGTLKFESRLQRLEWSFGAFFSNADLVCTHRQTDLKWWIRCSDGF